MSELDDLIARRDALNREIEEKQAIERTQLQEAWSEIYNALYDMLQEAWHHPGEHLLTRKNDITFEFAHVSVTLDNYYPDCIPSFMRIVLPHATVEFGGLVPVKALTAFIKAMEE